MASLQCEINFCGMQIVYGAAKTSLENLFFSFLPSILPLTVLCTLSSLAPKVHVSQNKKSLRKCFWIYNTHNFLIARIWIGPNKEIKSLHRNWLVTDYSFYACSV